MEHGTETEPIARKVYENLFGVTVKEYGCITPDEDNKYHDWIGISPDGITEGVLEIKCPMMKTHLGYIKANKLPAEYRHQVQGQLFVTGLPYCDFMSYVEGMKPFIIRVLPDEVLFEEFRNRLDILIVQVLEEINSYNKYDYEL
jgi:hypothetical protein